MVSPYTILDPHLSLIAKVFCLVHPGHGAHHVLARACVCVRVCVCGCGGGNLVVVVTIMMSMVAAVVVWRVGVWCEACHIV